MTPIFEFSELSVELLRQFDGTVNYFNCAHLNGKLIHRREIKLPNEYRVSDVVDHQNNVILQNYADDEYHYSFEDARWIDDNNISVCVVKYDVTDFNRLLGVFYKKYNLQTKSLYHFVTQRAHFEKNWQFYNKNIIYHVNPYIILDEAEQEIFHKNINWKPWIEKFGNPGLSTNVFEVHGEKFMLFHSYIYMTPLNMRYFVGLMKLNTDYTPYGYCINPFLLPNRQYTSNYILDGMWSWRSTANRKTVKYEVIFPMSVNVDDNNLHIYGGLNDCSSVKMTINKNEFLNRVRSQPFIVY